MLTELRAIAQSVLLAFTATPSPAPSRGILYDIVDFVNHNNILSGLVLGAIVSGYVRVRDLWKVYSPTGTRATTRGHPYWIAAVTLLQDTLFDELPGPFKSELTDKIVARVESTTKLNEGLVTAVRLLIEDRLLKTAGEKPDSSGEGSEPRTSPSVAAAFKPYEEIIDAIFARTATGPAVVTFENCFQLADLRAGVRRYFCALMKLQNEPPPSIKRGTLTIDLAERFITPIKVEDGFVAPSFLVAGLLQQFGDDWQKALRYFNDTLDGGPKKLIVVQRFEFFCWLLWGPSIPACTCNAWVGAFIALQYGYGDENNSFPLLIEDVKGARAKISSELAPNTNLDDGHPPLAFGSEFSGFFAWGPRYRIQRSHDYPRIYSVPAPADTKPYLVLGSDKVSVLEDVALLGSFTPLNAPRRYYSAYFWIMFQVCWDDKPPLDLNAVDRWKSLFPVFEHANVADGLTLSFLKERLAEKAIAIVQQLEKLDARIRFRYLCATDDPGDVPDVGVSEAHRSLFRSDERGDERLRNEVFANGGQPDLSAMTGVEKNRLRSILYEKLEGVPADRTRMFDPGPPGVIMTACDLPRIIQEFYQHLPHLK